MVNAEGSTVRNRRKVFAILLKVYGFLFLIATIATIISLVNVNDLLANAAHVNGEVIELSYDSKGRRAPVIRFKTTNNEIIQLKSDLYTSPAPKVGDNVGVVYRSSNPRDWRIDDWIHLYFWALLGLVMMFAWGTALTITALVGRQLIRKRE